MMEEMIMEKYADAYADDGEVGNGGSVNGSNDKILNMERMME